MIKSPLQLEYHFFSRIQLDAHPEAEADQQPEFDTKVECAQHEEDNRRWMVTLIVASDENNESVLTYSGEVIAIGMFRVGDEYPEEKMSKLVHANGAAILYGCVRELIANLTARGPFPQVTLPTMTFIDELADEKDGKAAKSDSKGNN